MSRRAQAPVRHILPDPKFNSEMLAKFMNVVMKSGKKSTAERIIYGAIDRITEKTGKQGGDALGVLSQALENVKPVVEVRSKRVGGANYQVPVEVSRKRQRALAFRWILESAREKKGKPLHRSLAEELLAAFNREGGAMAKRDNTHKMAEANKAFAHFAW